MNSPKAPPKRGSGFDDVMKDMRSKATFAQRERDTSSHAVESTPNSKPIVENTFPVPILKPVQRQSSFPESQSNYNYNRRSSEPSAEFLKQTRKDVAAELDR